MQRPAPRLALLIVLVIGSCSVADPVNPYNAISLRKLARACKFSSLLTNDDNCNRRVPGGTASVEVTCDAQGYITGLAFSYVLYCSFQDFTPALLELQKLRKLSLFRCGVKGVLDPEWGKLHQLRTLTIVDSEVSGSLPDSFGMLKNLVALHISSTRCCMGTLEGPLPRSLGNLKKLQYLDLSYMRINSTLPKEWGFMDSLKTLHLTMTLGVHGTIPEQWRRLARLEDLSLSHNNLEGPIPATLAQLSQLKQLDLTNNPQMCGPVLAPLQAALAASGPQSHSLGLPCQEEKDTKTGGRGPAILS